MQVAAAAGAVVSSSRCLVGVQQGSFGLAASSRARSRTSAGLVARAAVVPNGPRFLLARHGQTTFNAAKRFQGSLNEAPVLTEKGIMQARELGNWLQSLAKASTDAAGTPVVSKVFVSPLLRAQQTLHEIRKVAGPVLPDGEISFPELREIDLYEWEGKTQAEIQEEDPRAFSLWKTQAWELQLGSSRYVVRDLWARAAEAWELMRQAAPSPSQGPALVVAHGTLGKALLSTALGLNEMAFRHFAMKNGEVIEVAWPEVGSSKEGVHWRKRHPVESAWRSRADEEVVLQVEAPGALEAA